MTSKSSFDGNLGGASIDSSGAARGGEILGSSTSNRYYHSNKQVPSSFSSISQPHVTQNFPDYHQVENADAVWTFGNESLCSCESGQIHEQEPHKIGEIVHRWKMEWLNNNLVFKERLQSLLYYGYPCNQKRLIDYVLVSFIQCYPECTRTVIPPIASHLLRGSMSYDKTSPPFYAINELFINSFSDRIVNSVGRTACYEILAILTEFNLDQSGCQATWIMESLLSSSSGFLLDEYFEWMVFFLEKRNVGCTSIKTPFVPNFSLDVSSFWDHLASLVKEETRIRGSCLILEAFFSIVAKGRMSLYFSRILSDDPDTILDLLMIYFSDFSPTPQPKTFAFVHEMVQDYQSGKFIIEFFIRLKSEALGNWFIVHFLPVMLKSIANGSKSVRRLLVEVLSGKHIVALLFPDYLAGTYDIVAKQILSYDVTSQIILLELWIHTFTKYTEKFCWIMFEPFLDIYPQVSLNVQSEIIKLFPKLLERLVKCTYFCINDAICFFFSKGRPELCPFFRLLLVVLAELSSPDRKGSSVGIEQNKLNSGMSLFSRYLSAICFAAPCLSSKIRDQSVSDFKFQKSGSNFRNISDVFSMLRESVDSKNANFLRDTIFGAPKCCSFLLRVEADADSHIQDISLRFLSLIITNSQGTFGKDCTIDLSSLYFLVSSLVAEDPRVSSDAFVITNFLLDFEENAKSSVSILLNHFKSEVSFGYKYTSKITELLEKVALQYPSCLKRTFELLGSYLFVQQTCKPYLPLPAFAIPHGKSIESLKEICDTRKKTKQLNLCLSKEVLIYLVKIVEDSIRRLIPPEALLISPGFVELVKGILNSVVVASANQDQIAPIIIILVEKLSKNIRKLLEMSISCKITLNNNCDNKNCQYLRQTIFEHEQLHSCCHSELSQEKLSVYEKICSDVKNDIHLILF